MHPASFVLAVIRNKFLCHTCLVEILHRVPSGFHRSAAIHVHNILTARDHTRPVERVPSSFLRSAAIHVQNPLTSREHTHTFKISSWCVNINHFRQAHWRFLVVFTLLRHVGLRQSGPLRKPRRVVRTRGYGQLHNFLLALRWLIVSQWTLLLSSWGPRRLATTLPWLLHFVVLLLPPAMHPASFVLAVIRNKFLCHTCLVEILHRVPSGFHRSAAIHVHNILTARDHTRPVERVPSSFLRSAAIHVQNPLTSREHTHTFKISSWCVNINHFRQAHWRFLIAIILSGGIIGGSCTHDYWPLTPKWISWKYIAKNGFDLSLDG